MNTVEFFVAVAASVTFLFSLGPSHWDVIFALALGGVVAAPFGAWLCRKLPRKPFMVSVGILVNFLSLRTLVKTFG